MLKQLDGPLRFLIVALLAFDVVSWAITSSHDFQGCIAQGESQQSYRSSNEEITGISVSSVYRDCLGQLVRRENGAITAIATAILTLVTGGLVVIAFLQFSTNRAELRAYVFIDGARLQDGPTLPDDPVPAATGCPNFQLSIKNHGRSPAYEVRHFSDIQFRALGTEDALQIPADLRNLPPTTIGPGGTTTMGGNLHRVLTALERANLSAATPTHALIVYGQIEYKDVFGRKWHTNYRLGYSGPYPPPPQIILVFMNRGNDAT